MSNIEVNNFDLYNTTTYWTGYKFSNYIDEQKVTYAFYTAQFSSNPIGSCIDYFKELAGDINQNPVYNINNTLSILTGLITIDSLPYLWGKYWWDQAIYYSHPTVYSALTANKPDFYQPFSESIGSLSYISRINNFQGVDAKVYNNIIEPLIIKDISAAINAFYVVANTLFLTNKNNLGPNGTDTSPNNSNLIQADTDFARRVTSNNTLTATINDLYPFLNRFLPYNTLVIGNTITPYNWMVRTTCEDITIDLDFTNSNIYPHTQLVTNDLKAQ